MTVYVLEDTATHLQRIEHALSHYHNHIQHILWRSFTRVTDLLLAAINISIDDAFFLDIEIDGASQAGIRTAKIIQERQPDAKIIFITSYPQHAVETFDFHIRTLDFIDKSTDNRTFAQRIFSVLAQQNFIDYLAFKAERIPILDILYIDTLGNHRLNVATLTRDICIRANLKDFGHHTALLQISKNTLVNKHHVADFDKSLMTLNNRIQLPIARRFYKTVFAELLAK